MSWKLIGSKWKILKRIKKNKYTEKMLNFQFLSLSFYFFAFLQQTWVFFTCQPVSIFASILVSILVPCPSLYPLPALVTQLSLNYFMTISQKKRTPTRLLPL